MQQVRATRETACRARCRLSSACLRQRIRVVATAKRAQYNDSKRTKSRADGKRRGAKLQPTDGADEAGLAAWRFFSPQAYAAVPAWDVPWGWKTTLFGMCAWGISFVGTGVLSVPAAIELYHLSDVRKMTALQQSQITLLDQVLSTAIGVALIWGIGAAAKEKRPDDFLRFSLERPFAVPDGWLVWALLGIVLSPFVIIATSFAVSLVPVDASSTRGTVDAVGGMLESIEPGVFTNLLFVTGILAPLLEETIFRGFLLTSLTRYMPVPASVTVASLVFATCHLSLRDFPQLFALGMVMGFAYSRSRNLLTSVLIHGAWNSGVMALLFALFSAGVTMDEILAR